MGQMQRRKRIGREMLGLARRKLLTRKAVYRRFAEAVDRVGAAFTSLRDGLQVLSNGLHVFDEMVQVEPAWFDEPAKTFDKRITPP
jgi:hypothetical protein